MKLFSAHLLLFYVVIISICCNDVKTSQSQKTLILDINNNAENSFYRVMQDKIIPTVKNGGVALIPVKSQQDCQLLKLEDFEVLRNRDKAKNCHSASEVQCGLPTRAKLHDYSVRF